MKWPFVARSTFEEVARQRDELRTQLQDTRLELKTVNNYWIWRTSSAPIHPELIPAEYRVQPAPPEAKKVVDPMQQEIPTEIQEIVQRSGSKHPRDIVRGLQVRRNEEAVKAAPAIAAKARNVAVAASAFESDLKSSQEKTA